MEKKKTCVFISGTGSNLNALIKNSRSYNFPVKIEFVVSNKSDIKGIKIAKKFKIPYLIINTRKSLYENKIIEELKNRNIKIICLAGYMKILSNNFLNKFNGKIINIHPYLLPKFKGLNTFNRILKKKEKKTGCTIHYVNKKLDSGKIILKKEFIISKSDTVDSIKIRTQRLEHVGYSEALIKILRNN